jgi:hypothetical protein
MSSRPGIPDPVKREVRQRCGFGCVVCGLPLYEYDHIIPYSIEKDHRPENLVLLCDQHHREKTSGLLPQGELDEARDNPHNLRQGFSSPLNLHYRGSNCECIIGSNRHIWPYMPEGGFTVPLLIDDTPLVLFRVEDEHLLLTVQLFDRDNNLLVRILDNELLFSVDPWDVEFAGKRLTVRHRQGDIFVGMSFKPPSEIVIDQGRVWRNGYEIKFSNRRLVVPGENVIAGSQINCLVGIAIGEPPPGCPVGVMVTGHPREAFQEPPEVAITRLTAS